MPIPPQSAAGRAAFYAILVAAATLALLPFSPWAEALGAATGAVCVWMAAKSDPWTWPVGIANNLLYLVVFWKSALYADSLLQLFYIGVSIYGIVRWRSGRGAARVRPVARVSRSEAGWVAVATVAFAALLWFVLHHHTPSTTPVGDATTTALSLAAQWLMSRRFLENWWLWIAADLIYIPLYVTKDLWVTAALYAFFMVLCAIGLRDWHRDLVATRSAMPARNAA